MSHPNKPEPDEHQEGAAGLPGFIPRLSSEADPGELSSPIRLEPEPPRELLQAGGLTLPISEPEVSPQLLLLSPGTPRILLQVIGTARVQMRRIGSLEDYKTAVQEGLSYTHCAGSRWLIHALPIDDEGWPVMGGYRVLERELYGHIPRKSNNCLAGVQVFQLRQPKAVNESISVITDPSSSRVAFRGLVMYQFEIPNNVRWEDLEMKLVELAAQVSSMPIKPTANYVLDQLISFGLHMLVKTTLPIGLTSNTAKTITKLFNYPEITIEQVSRIAVGVFVRNYSCSEMNRLGCEADVTRFKTIARALGCRAENTYLLYNSGQITINNYKYFLKDLEDLATEQPRFREAYLVISTHCELGGFALSDGTIVQLPDLVRLLKKLALHQLAVYQPCRGDGLDLADMCIKLECLGLTTEGAVGSSLPQTGGRPDGSCSAIFASCPGYASYSNERTGSYLLQSLSEVLTSSTEFFLMDLSLGDNLSRLAKLVQANMRAITNDGTVQVLRNESDWCDVQFHLVIHSPQATGEQPADV